MNAACRCSDQALTELDGADAHGYVSHLVELRNDSLAWETEFECPNTQVRWLLDYPHSEAHGGGPSRLRRLPIRTPQLRRVASLALADRLVILSAMDHRRSMFVASDGDQLHLLRGDTLQIVHSWTLAGGPSGWHGASPDGPLAFVSGRDAVTLLEADGRVRWVSRHAPWSGARQSGCAWFDAGGRALAIVPDAQSEFCLAVHFDRESGRVIAERRVPARPAGITPVPFGTWMGLSEGEGQDAVRAWWVRLNEAGQLDLRDGSWSDEILTDCDQAVSRILTTPHNGTGVVTVRSFADLRVVRRIPAPQGAVWGETACFAKDRIVAQLLGDVERTVAIGPDDEIRVLDVGAGLIVGAADNTWIIARGNEIERWAFED